MEEAAWEGQAGRCRNIELPGSSPELRDSGIRCLKWDFARKTHMGVDKAFFLIEPSTDPSPELATQEAE